MFTKEDFINYFSEIEMLEKNMHDTYEQICDQVEDKYLKKVFQGLLEAESRHQGLVEEIRKMAIKRSINN